MQEKAKETEELPLARGGSTVKGRQDLTRRKHLGDLRAKRSLRAELELARPRRGLRKLRAPASGGYENTDLGRNQVHAQTRQLRRLAGPIRFSGR